MPNSVPNYLSTDDTGNVSASFPGGVTAQSDAFNSVSNPLNSVRWTDGPNGAQVASVGAQYAWDPRISRENALTVITASAYRTGRQATLTVATGDPAIAGDDQITAQFDHPNGRTVTIITGDGRSSFMQQSPQRNYAIFGPINTGLVAMPAGLSTIFNVPNPNNTVFSGMAALWVTNITSLTAHWNFVLFPNTNGASFVCQNNAAAQSVGFDYCGIGVLL